MGDKGNQRRNAFDGWGETKFTTAAGDDSVASPKPPTPLDLIPAAKPRSRNRQYEKQNRTFSYRLTDQDLGEKIAAVAKSLQVAADEVARAFVEAGLREAHAGRIPFNNVPLTKHRMTLYPKGDETWIVREQPGWQKTIPTREKKKMLSEAEKRKRRLELNQMRVSYRWPAETDKAITALAEKIAGKVAARSDGRKGWVLTILLRYSLAMYEDGKLPLQPQPKVVKMGLTW